MVVGKLLRIYLLDKNDASAPRGENAAEEGLLDNEDIQMAIIKAPETKPGRRNMRNGRRTT